MNDISDMSGAFIPKSNQLNNDQLIGGPLTIKITGVSTEFTDDKTKAVLHYENDGGRPYKPSLGMGRILLEAWGSDGNEWIGQSLTLYRDAEVMFGKDKTGGIRISHMSGIKGNFTAYVTVKRGRKTPYPVKLLDVLVTEQGPSLDELIAQLNRSKSNDDVKAANALAMDLNDADRAEYGSALDTFKEVRKKAAARKEAEDAALAEKQTESNADFLSGLESEDIPL